MAWTDELGCHWGTYPGLGVGTPQQVPHLGPSRMCEGAAPVEPYPQDLHDSGQQRIAEGSFGGGGGDRY